LPGSGNPSPDILTAEPNFLAKALLVKDLAGGVVSLDEDT